ncbi:DUF3626 domain-containing protein [Archangium sp.]|uniref:DUF3626 domain-containing protein n=1 Tax=Archangium sp. TaxID=1872627 RepID=UPI00286AA63E|nr:DUF3626 domain-containing protein [Archangium sp.]
MEIHNNHRPLLRPTYGQSSSATQQPSTAPAAQDASSAGASGVSSFTPATSGLAATSAASGVAASSSIEAPPPPVQQEQPKPVRRKRRKRRGLLGKLKRAFRKLGRGIKKMARGIKNVVKSTFKGVASLGKGLFKGFKALMRGDIKGAFKAVTQGIKDTVHHAFQALREALPLMTKLIPGVAVLLAAVPKLDKLVTNLQQGLVDSLASITQGVLNTTTRFVEGALDGASALARGDIKGAFKSVAQGARDSLKTGWKTFNEALPYLVTAACFVPGLNAVAIPLRVAMAARDLATAIKNKDALGIVGAVADGVAGGAAGRGLKLVTRAADMVGNGVSVAHGAQAAARGDALGAVAGLAGGAAGARGRVGEAAGQLSMGAAATQAALAGDSEGFVQAAGGAVSAQRGRQQTRASTTSRGLPPDSPRGGADLQLRPEDVAGLRTELPAPTASVERHRPVSLQEVQGRMKALHESGWTVRGGAGSEPSTSTSRPRGLPEASTSSRSPARGSSPRAAVNMDSFLGAQHQERRTELEGLRQGGHVAQGIQQNTQQLADILSAQKANVDKGLSPTAQSALQHARKVSQQQEAQARAAVIQRLQALQSPAITDGAAAYEACVKYLRRADITINFRTPFMDMFLKDNAAYLNMWERPVNTSDARYADTREATEVQLHGLPPLDRTLHAWKKNDQGKWEGLSHDPKSSAAHVLSPNSSTRPLTSQPGDRPHSAAVNVALHRAGGGVNPTYGTSHMVLRDETRQRTTLTGGDSLEQTWKKNKDKKNPDGSKLSLDTLVGTYDFPGVALQHLDDSTLAVLAQNALDPTGPEPKRIQNGMVAFPYMEAQVFGGINISRDVARLVIDQNDLDLWTSGRYPSPDDPSAKLPAQDKAALKQRLESFCKQHGIELEFIQTGPKEVTPGGVVLPKDLQKLTSLVSPLVKNGQEAAEQASHGRWEQVSELCQGVHVPRTLPARWSFTEPASLSAIRDLATQAQQYESWIIRGGPAPRNHVAPQLEVGKLAKDLSAAMKQYGPELGQGDHKPFLQKTLAHLGHVSDYFVATTAAA